MQKILESTKQEGLNLRLHHVGYAVASITDYVETFVTPFFQPESISAIVEDPIQQVRVVFVKLPGGVMDLIEPMVNTSPIHQILKRDVVPEEIIAGQR